VGAEGIDIGRVPEPELDVHGRSDADQLGDLVQADKASERVRHLDVDVERTADRGTDRRDLRQQVIFTSGNAARYIRTVCF